MSKSRIGLTVFVLLAALLASPATAQTPAALSDLASVSAPAVRSQTTTPIPTTTTSTTTTTPATTTTTPLPVGPTPSGPALLISDSAWLSFKLYGTMDAMQGFDHTMALASCRRRVSPSCENFDGYIPITLLEELDNHPTGFGTLIVATGYNDGDQNYASDIDDIVNLARSHGYERVVWLTLRSNVSYTSPDDVGFAEVFNRSNATLKQIVADGTYPELVIADWATFARDQNSWFANDGIHLRVGGSYAAGDYMSRKMAFLDSRPCPLPDTAGGTPLDPCPDPDSHGPVIDLATLYPMDTRGPEATFQLSWEGSGSWPNPPWWDL